MGNLLVQIMVRNLVHVRIIPYHCASKRPRSGKHVENLNIMTKYHSDGLITRSIQMQFLKSHANADNHCKLGRISGSKKQILCTSYVNFEVDKVCGQSVPIYQEGVAIQSHQVMLILDETQLTPRCAFARDGYSNYRVNACGLFGMNITAEKKGGAFSNFVMEDISQDMKKSKYLMTFNSGDGSVNGSYWGEKDLLQDYVTETFECTDALSKVLRASTLPRHLHLIDGHCAVRRQFIHTALPSSRPECAVSHCSFLAKDAKMQKENVVRLQTLLCATENLDNAERILPTHIPTYNEFVYEYGQGFDTKADHSILAFVVPDDALDAGMSISRNITLASHLTRPGQKNRTIPQSQWERAVWGRSISCKDIDDAHQDQILDGQ